MSKTTKNKSALDAFASGGIIGLLVGIATANAKKGAFSEVADIEALSTGHTEKSDLSEAADMLDTAADTLSMTAKAINILKNNANKSFSTAMTSGQAIGSGSDRPGGMIQPTIGATRQAASTLTNKKAVSINKQIEEELEEEDVLEDDALKSLNTSSYSIPFYLRQQKYDPNGIFRSATQQTSKMYTSLAPAVKETLQNISENEKYQKEHNTYKTCDGHGVTYKSALCPMCEYNKSNMPKWLSI